MNTTGPEVTGPEVQFDGKAFFAPFEAPDYPQISDGYLPPNVRIHIDFGRHILRSDYAPTREKLAACDVYIPEAAGHTQEWSELANRLAKSDLDDLRECYGIVNACAADTFEAAEVDAMCGSGKEILFVDGSSEDTTEAYEDDATVAARVAAGFASHDEAYRYMYEKEHAAVQDEAKRDRIMLRDLGPKLGRLVNGNPELRDKPEVFVLMRLGARHYPVYEALSQSPHTSDQVSAETVNFRTQSSMINRVEESIKRLIENGQKVPRQLIVAQYITNAVHELVPVNEDDIVQQSKGTALKNLFTQVLIASGPEEAALLIGRLAGGEGTSKDRLFIEAAYKRARAIYENSATVSGPAGQRRGWIARLRSHKR